ncbi:type II secretion system major pseudopilin GspG [Kordiimonas sp.]|uniref:type II secretion system major pseudopilin GspG n=1 Tax=Kordiimonas sp. TaxID=1970157 RepID=UPI003A9041A5
MIQSVKKLLRATLRQSRRDEGFSLIELMVVIVIIGLITTIIVVNVLPSQDRAMFEKARADVKLLEQAVEMYRMDTLKYPTLEQGVEVLTSPPKGAKFRSEGYIKTLPKDPWGNAYQYLYPGEHGAFDVYSFGADGRLGGEGLNADIGNWESE